MLDQNRFSQVFVNVLSNAIKFTNKGGITLNVLWAREDQHQRAIEEDVHVQRSGRASGQLSSTWLGRRGVSEPLVPRKNSSTAVLHKRVTS